MAAEQVGKPVQMKTQIRLRAFFARVVDVSGVLICGLVVLAGAGAAPAKGETLQQALAKAYRLSPRLEAARARLRATDEDVPQALAGWRPVITGSSDFGYESTKTKPRTSSSGRFNNFGYSLNLKQNLFDGFQTTNRVKEAEAGIRAERELLRQTEQEVLLRGATVYMDVIRDLAVVALEKRNVYVLTRALRAARARRAEREITRTDVAQSRARRAQAVSSLQEARAKLKASRAGYRRVIGARPLALQVPSYRSRLIPRSLRSALKAAQSDHPILLAAKFKEQAERYHVARVRGELLPEVNLEAHYGKRFNGSPSISLQEDARITGRITVPFYRGGQVHSRVRQAKHRHVARLQEIEQARLEVEDLVRSAWSNLRAARARLRSRKVQVRSAGIALEGVREEEKVGQRTIIELLNARQEFVRAQVEQTRTRHDLVVAAYTMVAAVGRLSAERLAVTREIYDAKEHYYDVRDKRFGTSITDDERDDDRREYDGDEVLVDEPYKLGNRPSLAATTKIQNAGGSVIGVMKRAPRRLAKRSKTNQIKRRSQKRLLAGLPGQEIKPSLRRPSVTKIQEYGPVGQAASATNKQAAVSTNSQVADGTKNLNNKYIMDDKAFAPVSTDLVQLLQEADKEIPAAVFGSETLSVPEPPDAVAGASASILASDQGLVALIKAAVRTAAGQANEVMRVKNSDIKAAAAGRRARDGAVVSAPRERSVALATASLGLARPAPGSAHAPPPGFRGALGGESTGQGSHSRSSARAGSKGRRAVEMSLVNANRKLTVIRGAQRD